MRDSLSTEYQPQRAVSPQELTNWRLRQHLSQGELAQHLGLHLNTVNRWERGEGPIPPWLDLALEGLQRRLAYAPLTQRRNGPGRRPGPPRARTNPALS